MSTTEDPWSNYHESRIVAFRRSGSGRKRTVYNARCYASSCSWQGPRRSSVLAATKDGLRHEWEVEVAAYRTVADPEACKACDGEGKPGMYCNDSSDPKRVQHCDGLHHPGNAAGAT